MQLYLLFQDIHGASHLRRYMGDIPASTQLSFLPWVSLAAPCCRCSSTRETSNHVVFSSLRRRHHLSPSKIVGQNPRLTQRIDSRSRKNTVAADIESASALMSSYKRSYTLRSMAWRGRIGRHLNGLSDFGNDGSPEICH